jgi:hypothetical protein
MSPRALSLDGAPSVIVHQEMHQRVVLLTRSGQWTSEPQP